jgi:hypothetical protein
MVSAFQCHWAGLDGLVERNRERALPIMQALVDEGKVIQAGEAVHQWGDEYNLLTWLASSDMPSALEAWKELTSRYDEAHPDDSLFVQTCPKHRDYFYTQRVATRPGSPGPPPPGVTPTLAISYFTCDYGRVGDIIEQARSRALPISQSLVDEGSLLFEAYYVHEWADEWNLTITRTAEDMPALLGALTSFNQRYSAQHGENSRSIFDQHCSAHKDNIYTVMMVTNP